MYVPSFGKCTLSIQQMYFLVTRHMTLAMTRLPLFPAKLPPERWFTGLGVVQCNAVLWNAVWLAGAIHMRLSAGTSFRCTS